MPRRRFRVVDEMRLSAHNLLTISVRTEDAGGGVTQASAFPARLLERSDRLTLLIHGYANTRAAATRGYDHFRSVLEPFDREAVNVYWPGDWGMIGLSQASYPFQRRRALDSVTELTRFFRRELDQRISNSIRAGRILPKLELRIIAHSLGCLVALELLKMLLSRSRNELEVYQLVLMAAAVPQYRLNDRDLGFVLAEAKRVRVYHSYRDWVLALAFPLGELPHRPFPEGWSGGRRVAIGRHGCGRRFDNVVEEKRRCGHSGYWSDETIAGTVRNDIAGLAEDFAPRKPQTRTARRREVYTREVTD